MSDTNNNAAGGSKAPSHIAYHVTDRDGGKGFWSRIGAAWTHQDGKGCTIQLEVAQSGGCSGARPTTSDIGQHMSNTIETIRQRRSMICYRNLKRYSTDEPETNLVDLLADAMHWCDQVGNDFDDILERARNHHWAETNGVE
jgi:hypothetical protein